VQHVFLVWFDPFCFRFHISFLQWNAVVLLCSLSLCLSRARPQWALWRVTGVSTPDSRLSRISTALMEDTDGPFPYKRTHTHTRAHVESLTHIYFQHFDSSSAVKKKKKPGFQSYKLLALHGYCYVFLELPLWHFMASFCNNI